MKDRTKLMFAEQFQKLARNKRIQDIQVKELCEACGTERTTFYYHFHDKYDLVAWIYGKLYQDEEKRSPFPNDEAMITRMLYRMLEKRAFFTNALQDYTQNNLRQYILNFYITSEQNVLMKYLGTDKLSVEQEYMIRNYSYGCMGHTIDWLLGMNKLTPEELAHFQYKYMPNLLKKAFRACRQRKSQKGAGSKD